MSYSEFAFHSSFIFNSRLTLRLNCPSAEVFVSLKQLLLLSLTLAAPKPGSEVQINAMLQIIRGYAVAEPERSFDLIEALADQANELINAAATLDGFVGSIRITRKGELMLPRGYAATVERFHYLGKQLAQLALVNFDLTKATADRFQRQEVRPLARLFIAQAVLSERLGSGVSSGEHLAFRTSF